MSKINVKHADLLMAMDAPKRQAQSSTGEDQATREGKLSTLLTEARTKGLALLQATTVLKGWTRVYHGAITENCTPLEVSNQIIGRAKKARGLAMADVPGFDPDYLGIVVFASTGLRPSPGIGLGGRYYIVCTDTLDDIPEPEYASMVADVSERDAIILTSARPIVVEQDEDEDDTDENTESK